MTGCDRVVSSGATGFLRTQDANASRVPTDNVNIRLGIVKTASRWLARLWRFVRLQSVGVRIDASIKCMLGTTPHRDVEVLAANERRTKHRTSDKEH